MTSDEVKKYVQYVIETFDSDPAVSEFQRGYLMAMQSVLEDCFMTQEERAAARRPKEPRLRIVR